MPYSNEQKADVINNKDGSESIQTTSLKGESDKFPLKDPLDTLKDLRSHRFWYTAGYSALSLFLSVPAADAVIRASEPKNTLFIMPEFTASILAIAAVTITGTDDWQRTTAGINLLQSRIRERFVNTQLQTKTPN